MQGTWDVEAYHTVVEQQAKLREAVEGNKNQASCFVSWKQRRRRKLQHMQPQ